jgi:HEAT repeat protein
LVYAWTDPSEPRYQGRRVSAWFTQYYRSGQFSSGWDDARQAEAVAALGALGTNALPFLLKECFAERRDPGRFTNVLMALASLPKPFQFPPFVPAAHVSHEAAAAIEIIRPPASVLLPRLTNALASSDHRQRRVALDLLGYVGEGGEAAVPFLVAKLKSEAWVERMLAAHSLARLGIAAKPALPALIEIVGDAASSSGSLFNGCRALGNLGPEATNSLPTLRRRWGTETDPDAKRHLATAICRITVPEPEVLDSIIAQLSDTLHCRSAIRALGEIGPNAKPAVPALQELATQTHRFWRQAAAALERIEPSPNATNTVPIR